MTSKSTINHEFYMMFILHVYCTKSETLDRYVVLRNIFVYIPVFMLLYS